MKNAKSILLFVIMAVLCLSLFTACGLLNVAPEPTPEPTAEPTPTPEPTPIIPLGTERYWGDETELDLTGTGVTAQELVNTLRRFSGVETVTISDCSFTTEEQADVIDAYPEIVFSWPVDVLGHTIDNTAEVFSAPDEGIDINALAEYAPVLPNIKFIELGDDFHEVSEIIALREAFGGATVACLTNYCDVEFYTGREFVDLTYGTMPYTLDEIDYLISALGGTQKLILPFFTHMDDEIVSEYAKSHDDIRIVWTVHFWGWNVRTDTTCFSSLQAEPFTKDKTSWDYAPLLRYCTDLVALDLGHNDLVDLSDFKYQTKLKYLILADNQFMVDITPLGDLVNLEYLELFRIGWIQDYSPLANLTKMEYLNLAYSRSLHDGSFVDSMPNLKMGWFRETGIPEEQQNHMIETHPDAQFLFFMRGEESSTNAGWRASDMNVALRTAFKNWWLVEDMESWDNITWKEGAEVVYCEPIY